MIRESQGLGQNLLQINLKSWGDVSASDSFMKPANRKIFDEEYRVVAVESQRLTIRGVRSGEVMTIDTQHMGTRLTPAEYPPGKLNALSDPTATPGN